MIPKAVFDLRFLSTIDKTAALLYFTMKEMDGFDIPITIKEVSIQLGLPEFTVKRKLKILHKQGWLNFDGKQVELKKEGEYLLDKKLNKKDVEIPEEKTDKNGVKTKFQTLCKRKRAERQSYLREKLRRKSGFKRNRKSGTPIKKHFYDLFDECFEQDPPKTPIVKERTIFKRLAENMDFDFVHTCEVLDFLFYNWNKIREELNINNSFPTPKLVGTYSMWSRIRDCYENGFNQVATKNRASLVEVSDNEPITGHF